jgi:hypothetical protein
MDESMVLSKAAVTRPHPESFAGAKSEKKYNMMCGANSGDKCKLPTAKAFDHHEGTLTSSIRRVCKLINSVDIPKSRWGVVACNKIDRKKRSTYEITYDVRDTSGNDADQAYVHLILFDYKAPKITQCITEGSFLEATTKGFFCGGTTAKDNVDMYKPKSTLRYSIFKGTSCKCNKCTIAQAMKKTNKDITFGTGKYSVYTYAHDFAGAYGKAAKDNKSEIKTKFTVRDTTPPKITIKGSTPVKHECATSYTDEGATASDALDNALFKRTGNKKYLIKVYNDHRTSVDHKTVTYKSRDSSFNRGGCHERSITTPFTYFNSGSATGCEHRHHYLYEYRGSDCIWTSSPTALKELGKYTYEWMRVEFKVADYGKMEYSDYVKVEMAPCLNGKCERFYQTELIRGDTKGNLGRRSIHDRYHGWYWQTVRQAKGRNANWMYQLDKDHNQVRIRITLKSNDNYNERHILDNLEIKGWACKKQHYTVAFKAQDSHKNKAKNVFRTVIVQDTTPPQLTVTGHVSKTITHLASVKKPAHTERVNSCADTCDGSRTVTKSWSGSAFNDRKLGTYTRKYHCTDKSGNTDTEYRKYEVVDKTAPLITCGKDSISGACHTWREASRDSAYTDASAKCNDYVDSHLPVRISGDVVAMRTPGTYKIHYDCTDKSGNKASRVTRKVVVKDTTKPVITLLGKKRVVLEAGFPYADAGSTATDTLDGDVTKKVRVSGNTVDVKSSFVNHFSCAEIKAEVATATSGAYVLTTSLKQRVEVYCDFKYSRTYLAVKKGIRAHPYGTAPGSCAKYGYEMSFKASSVGSAAYNAAKEYYMEYDAEESPYFPTSKTATSNYYLCSPKGDEASLSTVNYLSEHRNWKLGASPGKYTISYRVTDKAGNKQVKVIKRKVIVQDTLPPVISLHYAKKVKNSRDKTWWSDRYNGNPASRPVTRIARHKGKNVRKGTNPFLHFMAESSSVNGWMMGAIASAVAGVALLGFSTTKASTSVPV